MRPLHRLAVAALVALLAALTPHMFARSAAQAQAPERRFAFVIGNTEYQAGRQPTAANDAGLVAQTLRAAGFDVTGARDLDQETLRRSMRDFLGKVSAAGPDAVAFVYLAGYGLQFEGDNYFVPIDATLARDEDIAIEAFRISDFTRPLAGLPASVKIVVIDAARQHPFAPAGLPLASGLALVEPDPGTLVAFNATPGSIAPIENGTYGAYAQALSEMIATGGLGLDDLFARVRLRVVEKTGGVTMPWHASRVGRPFLFMERTANAPPAPQALSTTEFENRAMRDFTGDQEAFAAALARDTLRGYEEFLAAYPDSPLAVRVRAILAVRREAMTWRRTLGINRREAYWSYLQRYPEGAHVADAQRRLARLAAAFDPPPAFVQLDYDVPPPPPDEVAYLDQPAIVFDGPGFSPPPPMPVEFLPPPPPVFVVLEPPPPPIGPFFLPAPPLPFVSVDASVGFGVGVDSGFGLFVSAPAFVVLPPPPVIQQININNTIIINNQITINKIIVQSPALPPSLVTRVNAGALRPPRSAPPPPDPVHHTASLTGAGPLGKPTPPPGPARPLSPTTTLAAPGAKPSPSLLHQPGTGIATPAPITPGATAPGATQLGRPRPPEKAFSTLPPGNPGVTNPAVTPPGLPRLPGPTAAKSIPGSLPGTIRRDAPTSIVTGPQSSPPDVASPTAPRIRTPSGARPLPVPPVANGPPPPPAAVNRPPSPPPVAGRPPPSPVIVSRPPSPPPVASRPPPPPAIVSRPPSPPPAASRPSPPPALVSRPPSPPPVASRPPTPPAVVSRPPSPPPVASRPPPPPVVSRPPSPPPVASRPPLPPAFVSRPPSPPPVASRPPPPPVVSRPPPPVASRPPAPAVPPSAVGAARCTVQNGKPVCR